MKALWLFLLVLYLVTLVFTYFFYFLYYYFFDQKNNNKENYRWYEKHFKNETYYPSDFFKDLKNHLEHFHFYSDLYFILLKFLVYCGFFLIKPIQFFLTLVFLFYFLIIFSLKIFNKKSCTITLSKYYLSVDPRARFRDFFILIFIKIPAAKAFYLTYMIFFKLYKKNKSFNFNRSFAYTFLINKILGISLWNLFMLDYITIKLRFSIENEELRIKKSLPVFTQITATTLIDSILVISTIFRKVKNFKIIKNLDDEITFNPMKKFSGGPISTKITQPSSPLFKSSTVDVVSPNNKHHAAVIISQTEKISFGSIVTHKPAYGQKSIKIESSHPNDSRPSHYTINTLIDNNLIRPLSKSLEQYTGLDNFPLLETVIKMYKICPLLDKNDLHLQNRKDGLMGGMVTIPNFFVASNDKIYNTDDILKDIAKISNPNEPDLSPKSRERNVRLNKEIIDSQRAPGETSYKNFLRDSFKDVNAEYNEKYGSFLTPPISRAAFMYTELIDNQLLTKFNALTIIEQKQLKQSYDSLVTHLKDSNDNVFTHKFIVENYDKEPFEFITKIKKYSLGDSSSISLSKDHKKLPPRNPSDDEIE